MTIEHLDPEGEQQHCPTCGQRVGIYTSAEGTSFYLATAEQEASEVEFLRAEVKRLKGEIANLEQTISELEWPPEEPS